MTILSEETINKLVEMSRRYPKRFRGLPERIPPNDPRLHEVRHQDTLVEMPNYRSLDEWRGLCGLAPTPRTGEQWPLANPGTHSPQPSCVRTN